MMYASQSFELPFPLGEGWDEGAVAKAVRVAPHPNLLPEREGIRGTGWWRSAIALFAVLFPFTLTAADAPHWQVMPEKSSLTWTATYGGKPVTGAFPDYTADIAFDPAHLDQSHVTVKIETAKVKSDDKDAQGNLPTSDWFAAKDFPLAVFEASHFVFTGVDSQIIPTKGLDGNYKADGTLTIRGKQVKVTLPFDALFCFAPECKETGATPFRYAYIKGETTLKRLDFGIGQGDWADTVTIANDVKVTVNLQARRAP